MPAAIERTKLTPPELARKWGVSTNKILTFIISGELPAVNLALRTATRPRYAIDLADIERFERSRQVVPDGQPVKRARRKSPSGVKEFF